MLSRQIPELRHFERSIPVVMANVKRAQHGYPLDPSAFDSVPDPSSY